MILINCAEKNIRAKSIAEYSFRNTFDLHLAIVNSDQLIVADLDLQR